MDRSIPAVDAGDLTIAATAGCEAMPGRGADICRVKEGDKIEAVWRLILPAGKNHISGGELRVYYRDVSRTYAITGPLVEIPWKDFFAADTWASSMDGQALALAEIRWTTPLGIEEIWKARGLALIVVTKAGYDPLPIDSGFATWGVNCKVQYSTAGRGAISCR